MLVDSLGLVGITEVDIPPEVSFDRRRLVDQLGDPTQGKLVALGAEAGDRAVRPGRDERVVAECLVLVDVGDVDLDHRRFERVQCIKDRDRGMGERGGVDDDANGGLTRLMNPVDDLLFAVALVKAQDHGKFLRQCSAVAFDVGKSLIAIDMRLALSEQVQLRAIQDVNKAAHAGAPFRVTAGYGEWGRAGRSR